ncbi:unnamed protein product [Cylindrotheca closterium]|uniref:RBR-type E3 ubiquitin transferase n=1 Tax=Cylindrotheca closterium TaxID=2856 RepID=A0AAD2FXH6_9STRA|nr:unnamed protein product [Cylindrotheca closterium]
MRDLQPEESSNDYLEMAESNMDWSATAAIYVEESKVVPLLSSVEISTTNSHCSHNKHHSGFCGRVQLTLHAASSSLAFCRKVTEDNQYRYFTLAKPPILNIKLVYSVIIMSDDEEQVEEGLEDSSTFIMPSQVKIDWEYYPPELPELEKPTIMSWLNKKCQVKLQEETELMTMCASFSIVELCEHELWSYWETIHEEGDYRLILLPPQMDLLYHSNVGSLLNPRQEALAMERKMQKAEDAKRKATKSKRNKDDKSKSKSPPAPTRKLQFSNPPKDVLDYAKQALILSWQKLYMTKCPICFDTTRCDKGVTLPSCGHFFCQDCFPIYLKVKVTELAGYRTNPFLCPIDKCRSEISIDQTVQCHITSQEYKQIQRWQRDLQYPICYSLDRCLSKACVEETTKMIQNQDYEKEDVCMRKRSKDAKNTFVFCDCCDKSWCELCLKRIKQGVTRQEHREVCEFQTTLKFCRRYIRATPEQKKNCESKYPWIVNYAVSRQHDGVALQWILENGQCCPNCSNGVERIEGCFHMKCPTCATHFCYECGQELFPPYYGTHHCWEEDNGDFNDQFQ